jgi:hypothetical protein
MLLYWRGLSVVSAIQNMPLVGPDITGKELADERPKMISSKLRNDCLDSACSVFAISSGLALPQQIRIENMLW